MCFLGKSISCVYTIMTATTVSYLEHSKKNKKKTVMVQEYLKVEEGLHENPDYLWNKAKVTAQYMKQLQKT